jgi:broad specificity phosphatase PhoE
MSHAVVAAASAKASALSAFPYRIRLLFVRHGESQMNTSAHLLGGQHNHVPLTQKGINQATLLGRRLLFDRTTFDHVYSSTAVRAVTTAEIALKHGGSVVAPDSIKVEQSASLLEQDQGDWEGMHRKDVYTAEVHQEMLDLVRTHIPARHTATYSNASR